MTKAEILRNIEHKFEDASLLLDHGRHANSIYLCGYCVELALKFAITRNFSWPSYRTTGNNYRFLKVHDLDFLVTLTGKELEIKKMPCWSIVRVWNEQLRYEDPEKATAEQSRLMVESTKELVEKLCEISL